MNLSNNNNNIESTHSTSTTHQINTNSDYNNINSAITTSSAQVFSINDLLFEISSYLTLFNLLCRISSVNRNWNSYLKFFHLQAPVCLQCQKLLPWPRQCSTTGFCSKQCERRYAEVNTGGYVYIFPGSAKLTAYVQVIDAAYRRVMMAQPHQLQFSQVFFSRIRSFTFTIPFRAFSELIAQLFNSLNNLTQLSLLGTKPDVRGLYFWMRGIDDDFKPIFSNLSSKLTSFNTNCHLLTSMWRALRLNESRFPLLNNVSLGFPKLPCWTSSPTQMTSAELSFLFHRQFFSSITQLTVYDDCGFIDLSRFSHVTKLIWNCKAWVPHLRILDFFPELETLHFTIALSRIRDSNNGLQKLLECEKLKRVEIHCNKYNAKLLEVPENETMMKTLKEKGVEWIVEVTEDD